jgi:hypothetical protein
MYISAVRGTLLRFVIIFLCVPGALAQMPPSSPGLVESDQNVDVQPEAPVFTPNVKPTLHVHPVAGEIKIDGVLDDEGWIGAAVAGNFTEFFPDEQTEPPIEVSALMAYDDANLYVAFKVDDDPGSIRANLTARDNIFRDDYVGLILDIKGDGQGMYFIAANPYGIQGDTRISPNSEDDAFNLIYDSEGKITEDGYQVEMAIPFRSLRFPRQEVQLWRATFWITHPRNSRSQYSWASINRDDSCWSCQFGYIEGIEGVESGRNFEALPSLVGGQAGSLVNQDNAAEGFDAERINLEPSLDLKYGITSDLTAELTLNPDFSQIESDVAQIDVNSTFALFFAERRPFFQEGSDLFQSYIQTMYSRQINDPILAGKTTGRIGRTDVALLTARDNNTPLLLPFEERSELVEVGKSYSNIARIKHAFPNTSYIGALVTDRRVDSGGSGSTVGLDGMWQFAKVYALQAQFVASHTLEPDDPSLSEDFADATFSRGAHTTALDGESFSGHALYTQFQRYGRHWLFEINYRQFSPTFRADNGFIRQNDLRSFVFWQGLNIYPKPIGFIDRIMPNFVVLSSWNYDNVRKEMTFVPRIQLQMKGQTSVFAGYAFSRERFLDLEFEGMRMFHAGAFSNFSRRMSLELFLLRGLEIHRNSDNPELGQSLSIDLSATVRPTDWISVSPSISYANLTDRETGDHFYNGYVTRTRISAQFTRRLTLRTVVQYNDFSERLEIDPLVTYRINPLTVFHVGSTHDLRSVDTTRRGYDSIFRQTERQYFFKFQYLVRA